MGVQEIETKFSRGLDRGVISDEMIGQKADDGTKKIGDAGLVIRWKTRREEVGRW